MENKIDKALEYYNFKSKEILDFINSNTNLTVVEIIEAGEALFVIENKITSLEVAKEN